MVLVGRHGEIGGLLHGAGLIDLLAADDCRSASGRHAGRRADQHDFPNMSCHASDSQSDPWFSGRQIAELDFGVCHGSRFRPPLQRQFFRQFFDTRRSIAIGELAVCGIPFETFAEIGLDLKRRSPFPLTMVIGQARRKRRGERRHISAAVLAASLATRLLARQPGPAEPPRRFRRQHRLRGERQLDRLVRHERHHERPVLRLLAFLRADCMDVLDRPLDRRDRFQVNVQPCAPRAAGPQPLPSCSVLVAQAAMAPRSAAGCAAGGTVHQMHVVRQNRAGVNMVRPFADGRRESFADDQCLLPGDGNQQISSAVADWRFQSGGWGSPPCSAASGFLWPNRSGTAPSSRGSPSPIRVDRWAARSRTW